MSPDISGWRKVRKTGNSAVDSTEIGTNYKDDEGKNMKCILCGEKFVGGKIKGRLKTIPYCEKHTSKEVMNWTFKPNDKAKK